MPEAGLNLAHAVIHLALAPKSNSVKASLLRATETVRTQKASPVPKHLRDASYRGAQRLGHGKGYVYPHDTPEGWVPQQHLPQELEGTRFYLPGAHGAEPGLAEQLARRRRALRALEEEAPTVESGDDGDE
jgi:putative ATPase